MCVFFDLMYRIFVFAVLYIHLIVYVLNINSEFVVVIRRNSYICMTASVYVYGYFVYIIIVFCGQSYLICSFVVLIILIVLSVFMLYIVLRLWYSVVVCVSVRRRRKCLFDITFFFKPRGVRCEIALGLRLSLYRRKSLLQLRYFYCSVFGSF